MSDSTSRESGESIGQGPGPLRHARLCVHITLGISRSASPALQTPGRKGTWLRSLGCYGLSACSSVTPVLEGLLKSPEKSSQLRNGGPEGRVCCPRSHNQQRSHRTQIPPAYWHPQRSSSPKPGPRPWGHRPFRPCCLAR